MSIKVGVVVGFMAACTATSKTADDEVGAQQVAVSAAASSGIGYSYTELASYPADGLTATNVKDAIDESAAVAYGAIRAADDALAAAKAYTDERLAPCASTCRNSVTTINHRDTTGACVLHFRSPCAPFGCDAVGVTCNDACQADTDCAQGASCDPVTNQCAVFGTVCRDDFTIEDSNGQIESCIPYKCVGGACQQQCQSSNDCYDGYHCSANFCAAN